MGSFSRPSCINRVLAIEFPFVAYLLVVNCVYPVGHIHVLILIHILYNYRLSALVIKSGSGYYINMIVLVASMRLKTKKNVLGMQGNITSENNTRSDITIHYAAPQRHDFNSLHYSDCTSLCCTAAL